MAVGIGYAILKRIGENLVDPIGRQFSYLFCFNNNIQNLQTQLEDLKVTREGVQQGVDEAHNNVRTIARDVQEWLNRVNQNTTEAQTIIESKAQVQTGCLKGWCLSRYSLSRKAVKKSQDLVRLRADRSNLTQLSYNPPPPSTNPIPTTELFKGFESRRLTTDEIIKNLENDEINLIGICGMGGIGKTTMVKEVANKTRENNKFHDISFVVVKQQPDMIQIQKDIAETLGLELKQDNLMVRADLLRQRLSAGKDNKRILLILDDVWEQFNLNDVGIPLVSGSGCKILYTSRNRDQWNDVRTKKEIHIGLLREEEAWQLFREEAGDSTDDPELQPIAKQIVNECGRLPLALVTIGSALNNSIKHKWEDVLLQLQMPQSRSSLSGVPAKVYKPLELSYTCLEDDEAKHLFLLCCLVEEDYDIPIEDLARYGMGLSLFEGINDLGKIRNRVFALVDHLKSRHLLLDSKEHECVKVHDVVRDVGISIASKDKEKRALVSHGVISEWPKKSTYEDYTSISLVISKEIAELPEGLRCPKLELLLLVGRNILFLVGRNIISPLSIFHEGFEHNKKIPDNFFEEMGELKVLELRSLDIPLMPLSLGFLRNLKTLCVYSCLVNNISVIGELLNLEILTFRYFDITELPAEIGKLTNLKLLDLTGCDLLKRIPPGVISGLVRLEELYMRGSGFTIWEEEGMEEGRNASLGEFEFLSNLNTLEILIQIKDGAVLQRIPLFSKLTKYTIIIHHSHFDYSEWGTKSFQKHLQLSLNMCIPLNCEINSLLRSTESVELDGYGSDDLVCELYREGVKGLQHLKNLDLSFCNTPEYLANSTDWVLQPNTVVFPILESLYLNNLSNLREICHGQLPAGSFGKLSLLNVYSCYKLKNLFRLSIVRCLVQLKHLEIYSCDNMEEVIWNERGEDVHDDAINKIEFPKLEIMKLGYLRRLTSFCRGIDEIAFPQLKKLTLDNLSPNAEDNDNAALLSIFTQKIAFPSLEELNLGYHDNLERLGHNSISVGSFSKLRKVNVECCGKLLYVFPSQLLTMLRNLEALTIELEMTDSREQESEMLSLLKYLKLRRLPQLNYISKRDPIGFMYTPQLSILRVHDCDNLRYLFPHSVMKSILQLQELEIRGCKRMSRIVGEENGQGKSLVDEIEFSQLKILRLYNLPNLVSFFPKVIATLAASTEHTQNVVQTLFNEKVVFPNLEVLELEHLDNVEALGLEPLSSVSLSKLRNVHVGHCGKLLKVFPSQLLTRLQNLEKVTIEDCSLLKKVFELEVVDCTEHDSKIFLLLKSLKLKSLPQLNHISERDPIGFMYIPQLSILHIDGYDNLRFLFPQSMTKSMLQLQELDIRRSKMMSRIVAEENGQSESSVDKIEFAQLKILRLYDLPNLVSFFPKVITTVAASIEHLEKPGQSLFNEKVAFPSLKDLLLDGIQNMNEVWCSHLQIGSFYKLTYLRVSNCDSLRNLFSPYMARYLVHLKWLVIDKCSMMEEVVAKEEIEGGEVEGRIDRTRILPNLEHLELINLSMLKCFCHSNHDWELPLVDDIRVLNCPKMKTFSPSVIRTPKLQKVLVKEGKYGGYGVGAECLWMGDLNQTILHLNEKVMQSSFEEFESRIPIMEEIIEALKDDKINLIGVCGMGGVGKTTMVKQVAKIAEEKNLFHEVAMAVVSQEPNLKTVRSRIAEMLGLQLGMENPLVRASQPRQRLLPNNKKILVILDDVWEDFDLEVLRFPLGVDGNKGCKILFTSQSRNMWSGIQNKRNIQLEVLSKEEAWHLFKEKAGDYADSPDLLPLAKEIVDKCGGLPLALVTMGSALVKERNQYHWKDALRQLRTPCAETILSGVLAKVYRALDFNYSFLKDERAKKLFMLCCLYTEDYEIPIENLVRCTIGLQWFEGVNEVDDVRDRVHVLVDQLKSWYLLLDGDEEEEVKMHGIVRNVAISIASRDEHVLMPIHGTKSRGWPKKAAFEHYTSISVISDEIAEFPEGLSCPKLEFLLIKCRNSSLKIPNNFFEGLGELKVLELGITENILLLPVTFKILSNLRTLCLDYCHQFDNISVIGELLNLEILSFCDSRLEELPEEIGKLVNLRLLDLTRCDDLRRIPHGVISALVQLQELYMIGCRIDWEREGKEEGENASMREFKSLSNLNALEINLGDAAVLSGNLWNIFSNLKKYSILMEEEGMQWKVEYLCTIPSECRMNSPSNIIEFLKLGGKRSTDVVHKLVREGVELGVEHLKGMSIERRDTPECLFNTMDWVPGTPILSILEDLCLSNLPNLREIFQGQLPVGSLIKPSFISIYRCDKLENLFQLSIARCLLQRKHLQILYYDIMEEVIWKEERGEDAHAHDAQEVIWKETGLPRFIGFWIDEIEFPQLKELHLKNLPKLKRLFANMSSDLEDNHNAAFSSIYPLKVAFPSLEVLELSCLDNLEGLGYDPLSVQSFSKLIKVHVRHCGKLLNVIPSQLFAGLQNLEELTVEDCTSLEQVFKLEGVDYEEQDSKMLSSLKSLKLKNLPKLNDIPQRDSIGFMYIPQLSILQVHDLDSLRYLFSPVMIKSIPQLQELDIMRCKLISRIVAEENGQGEISVDKIEFPHLKILRLRDMPNFVSFFPEVIDVVAASNDNLQSPMQPISKQKIAFPSLEVLELKDLHKLEGLAIGIMHIPRLTILHVHDCHRLRYLFLPATVKSIILQLQELEIMRCKIMTRIIAEENVHGETLVEKIEFPQLKILLLYDLPNLVSFIPKVVSTVVASHESIQSPVQHFFNENVTFPWLEKLRVSNCGSFRNLFYPFMAKYLVHLHELIISKCSMVEEVVSNGENKENGEGMMDRIWFPKLKHLELRDLPVLKSFFHVNHEWELPLLESITVFDCPQTETLSPGFLRSPNLQIVWVKLWAPDTGVEGFWTNDLNDTLRQVYSKLQEQLQRREQQQQQQQQQQEQLQHEQREQLQPRQQKRQEQLQLDMTDKKQPIDKMSVWATTRRTTDPDVIQIVDKFDRQLSMLPEEGRTTEAKDAIFHDLVGKDGHGYCRTYGKTTPWRAVYGGEAGPSQSIPQAPTIVEITEQVRAELREELKEEMRAEFTAQLEQMKAEMLTLMSQGGNIDPNRQVSDASSSMQLNWSSRT